MSSRLWKSYYEDDVDTFRQLLETAAYSSRPHAARGGLSAVVGSAGHYGTPPSVRSRKAATPGSSNTAISKAGINGRDAIGLTLLHHVASSTGANAAAFAQALLEHSMTDLHLQDYESGWTPLHRAFYFGNITIARLILERSSNDVSGRSIIKIKDREGNGPLDLYAATIKDRTLRPDAGRQRSRPSSSDDEVARGDPGDGSHSDGVRIDSTDIKGDQLFTFGSNQNVTLGFGDQDNRQFPERVNLRQPEHLVRRFYREHLEQHDNKWSAHDPAYESRLPSIAAMWIDDMPWVMRSQSVIIQDVHMAKLDSAVVTSDPESNLHMCGHGQGGRLGTGDERTRFNFVCIEGGALAGQRVATVALGQNHTLALSVKGEIFSWGSNGFGQLGYSLPKVSKDEEPVSTLPRQIYGPLKRETVNGIAASRIHSVAFTSSSLFTWGKNEGQLGIIDSDARSLEMQIVPRKVAASLFSSPISAVTAIDRATVCLLENHDVWIFANYGYAKVQFPLDGFTNYFLKQSFMITTYDHGQNKITKIISEGDTICALSSRGEVYTLAISQRLDNQTSASTTNPSKIRSAITPAQRVWSPKKSNMAARDVGVDADGSIIISTEEGSVWRRTARAKMTDTAGFGNAEVSSKESKSKDYKFARIPGLTRVLAVRSSGYGAYAAVRRDCDVLKTQIVVEDPKLWRDLLPLLSLRHLIDGQSKQEEDENRPRFWQAHQKSSELMLLRKAILSSKTIEADLEASAERALMDTEAKYDAVLATTTSKVVIPVHRFMLACRSRVLRRGFRDLCETSTFTIPDLAVSEIDEEGRVVVKFQGLDILTVLDLALYLYTDTVVDFWHFTKNPALAHLHRQVRTELMKIAGKLEMIKLEPAVRQMVEPRPCLDMDLEIALTDASTFYDADVVVQLEDDEVSVHSALVCARCPFFAGLFMGRAGGRWLAGRGDSDEVTVDLKHMSSRVFQLVLRHIYCDTGVELFDEVVSVDLDNFLDLVLDVMSAANELMLDRLSQVAQSVSGRYVNVRNVCGLLNAIAPCSVREFKDAGLEYLCLNLEAMLQGHHLNELEEDLLHELDEVVRQNQLACMPFAKSGRADLLLHERHPGLAALIDRNRQARIDSVTLRTKFHDAGAFAPGSVGEEMSTSPMAQKARRRSSNVVKANVDRPSLKAKASSKDMMFDMDEDPDFDPTSPRESPAMRPISSPRGLEPIPQNSPLEDVWYDRRGKVLPSPKLGPQSMTPGAATSKTPRSPQIAGRSPPVHGKPWTLTPLTAARTDMREIMAQASSSRISSLSEGLASVQNALPEMPSFALPAPRMSQKDRKRMQHGQPAVITPSQTPPVHSDSPSFSWHAVAAQKKTAMKEVLQNEQAHAANKQAIARTSSTPQLTMRQTVAHAKSPSSSTPIIGPGGPSTLQHRSASDSKHPVPPESANARTKFQPASIASFANSRPIPQSIRHQPLPEQISGLSISEIVAQQLQEKDLIKDAAAKRDLQEIQAEQEFQEWWEKESAKVQEAERRDGSSTGKPKRQRGRGGGRAGKGGKAVASSARTT